MFGGMAGCALVVLIFLRASQVEQNELRYRVHEQAKLMLASLHVGRAVCTVSSAYCRLTRDWPPGRRITHGSRQTV